MQGPARNLHNHVESTKGRRSVCVEFFVCNSLLTFLFLLVRIYFLVCYKEDIFHKGISSPTFKNREEGPSLPQQ